MSYLPRRKPETFKKLLRQPLINLLYDSDTFVLRFPKYCKSLILRRKTIHNPKCNGKLKRCQRLSSIKLSGFDQAPLKPMLKILQSQRKYLSYLKGFVPEAIRFCPKVKNYQLDLLSSASWRVLSHLKDLEKIVLTIPYKDELQKELITFIVSKRSDWYREMTREGGLSNVANIQEYFWKVWLVQNQKKLWCKRLMNQMILHLSKLKHLKVLKIRGRSFNSRVLSLVMGKLNQQRDFLKSKKKISVDVSLTSSGDLASEDFRYPNLYGHITKLRIGDAILPAAHYVLSDMGRFENLRFLEIDKKRYERLEYETQKRGVNFEMFKCLEGLKKLEKISMGIVLGLAEHLKFFLETFSLPKNIESIKLTLHSVTWKDVLQELEMNLEEKNPFERSSCFVNFFNRWRNLDKVKDLHIIFKETNDLEVPTMYFLNSLMQRLSTLKTLNYINESADGIEKKEDFDFGLFWNSIKNLRQSLRTIKIHDKSITLQSFEGDAEEMAQLENLGIYGEMKGYNGLDKMINRTRKVDKLETMRIITIKTIKILGREDLFVLFENILKKSKKLYLEVYLDVREIVGDVFIDELERFTRKLKLESLLSLYAVNSQRLDFSQRRRLTNIVGENPVFISFSINTIDNETIHYM